MTTRADSFEYFSGGWREDWDHSVDLGGKFFAYFADRHDLEGYNALRNEISLWLDERAPGQWLCLASRLYVFRDANLAFEFKMTFG